MSATLYALTLLRSAPSPIITNAAQAPPAAPVDPSPPPTSRTAYVSISSKYARTMVLKRLRDRGWTCVGSGNGGAAAKASADLQFAEYERIHWDSVLAGKRAMANAYCVRRGLTRKAALAQVCSRWVEKYGEATPLARSVPFT